MRLASHEWSPNATDAPTALILHGITGSSGTWWRVGPALAAAGWGVIALDLPGHGASPRMRAPMKAADWASAVRETLGGEAVDLAIGHSAGGATLLEAVAQDSGFARRLVLEDPPAGDASRPEWAEHLERQTAAARRDPDRFERLLLRQNPTWQPQDAAAAVAALHECEIDVIAAMERRGMGYRVAKLVPTVGVPVLLLLAEEEGRSALTGDARRAVLAGAPPTMTVTRFRTGHVIHRDAFDEYVAAILSWANSYPREVRIGLREA